jgi:predicted transcriptional regulator
MAAKSTLSMLGEKAGKEENPAKLLREIFEFINFKKAKINLYFLLLESKKPLTIKEIVNSLHYSERTVRKYLKELLNVGYIKRVSTERERPCYAYSAIEHQ